MKTVTDDRQQHTPDEETYVVDRAAFSVVTLDDADDERQYWWSRTPQERMCHLEYLRRVNYGDRANEPLERVLEVVNFPPRE